MVEIWVLWQNLSFLSTKPKTLVAVCSYAERSSRKAKACSRTKPRGKARPHDKMDLAVVCSKAHKKKGSWHRELWLKPCCIRACNKGGHCKGACGLGIKVLHGGSQQMGFAISSLATKWLGVMGLAAKS